MSKDTMAMVLEFHEAFDPKAIGDAPGLPEGNFSSQRLSCAESLRWATQHARKGAAFNDPVCLRLALICEELAELAQACVDEDVEAALDALVDLRYVLDGTAIAFGFHRPYTIGGLCTRRRRFDEAFKRVHAANMAKRNADGTVTSDATGKVVKPEGWVAADLSDLVI